MEEKKYSASKILLALAKSALFVACWIVIQIVTSFVVQFILVANNPTLTDSELESLFAKNTPYALIISDILAILVFFLIYRLRGLSVKDELLVNSTKGKNCLLALGLGVTGQCIIIYLATLLLSILPKSWITMLNNSTSNLTNSSALASILSVVIVAPLLEEILFRGIVLGSLINVMPKWVAIATSSAIFGIMHLNPIGFIYATFFGAIVGFLYTKYNSIIPALICHSAFNLTSYLLPLLGNAAYNILVIAGVPGFVLLIFYFISSNKSRGEDK